ncbi:MAG: NTP transferase domain-containing protein [Kyrpidia tusciae]|nr:NTP transferase domain-containing protein [Kyrpidia tusciae]MBE3552160.1 NTP transferase domain-containing protein [Kyrpidia tusciae]
MDAIVLAGGSVSDKNGPKALWSIQGRAMVDYVLDALSAAGDMERIAVVGQTSGSSPRAVWLPGSGSIVDHLKAALEFLGRPRGEYVLIATCDVPLLTGAMVEDFLGRCRPFRRDFYYPIVRREDCERELPGIRRTYVKLRDGTFTGGNLFVIRDDVLSRILPVIDRFIRNRKNPLRLSKELGWSFTVRLAASRVVGVLSIDQLESRVRELFAVRASAVICPHAAIGADVDEPEDLGWVDRALAARLS